MAYHHALGIEDYPRDAGIFQFLDRKVETVPLG